MAKSGDIIWVEGEKELFLNMQKSLDGSLKAARQGLRKAGMQIIADSVQNLRNNGSWATGQLAQSGKVQAVEGDEDSIDVGFFGQGTQGGYAAFVEYGRKSGRMPPVDYIIQWVRKKLRLPPKEAKSAGWAMARKIAKQGTKPHPFFEPAVKKNENAIQQAIADAVKQEIK